MNLLQELKWRGLIYDIINEDELSKRLEEGPITLYCGFDPTADSMHIGSLLPIVTLMRFRKAGHNIILLTGGGTGLIGDPSGKKNERSMNSVDIVLEWSTLFKKQFSRFIEFDGKTTFSVDNYEWLSKMKALELWRDYGKHFSINYMLSKESVKSRLENGLTYLEFSYMIMQAIDFLMMYQNEELNCQMQIGGQDQWGNITAGMELIRKVVGSQAKVFGLTIPLITKSDGSKFGKTESGAIWLDEAKTSPYEMYQFFINTADSDVIKFLKYYTFFTQEEISALEKKTIEEPHLREAQKALAKDIVTLVHGEESYKEAVKITQALFDCDIEKLNAKEIQMACKDFPSIKIEEDTPIVDVIVAIGAATSKREARTFITGGGVNVNGQIIKDLEHMISKKDAIEGLYTIIRRGKKNYYLINH